MMNKKRLIALVALLLTLPVLAVFNERDLGQTLAVLRYELGQENARQLTRRSRIRDRGGAQHDRMVDMIKKCNELALMLYSQNQDCTLDMAYALSEVTSEYEEFNSHKLPFDEIVTRLDLEVDRYSRLIESLRRLPPSLNSVPGLPDSLAWHGDSLFVDFTRRHRSREYRAPLTYSKPDSLNAEIRDSLMRAIAPPVPRDSTFILNAQGMADRDSCLAYAVSLLKMYSEARRTIIRDSDHYKELSLRLKESYDYAQDRYKVLQKRMFMQSQDNFFKVLLNLPAYVKRAFQDAKEKYARIGTPDGQLYYSEWRGPIVAGFMLFVLLYIAVASLLSVGVIRLLRRFIPAMQTDDFAKRMPCLTILCGFLIFAITIGLAPTVLNHNFFKVSSGLLALYASLAAVILLSVLIRLNADAVNSALKLYCPILVLGLIVVIMRIVFIPNRMMNLLVPPLFLGFFIWHSFAYKRFLKQVQLSDKIANGITLGVLFIVTVLSWLGYVFLGMQVMIWWVFQLGGIGAVTALHKALTMYERKRISRRIGLDPAELSDSGTGVKNGKYIRITWFRDFIEIALFPILAVLTIPLALQLALDVFDLTGIYNMVLNHSFFNLTDKAGSEILKFTLRNVLTVVCLLFLFKYLNYLIRSLYNDYRLAVLAAKSGEYEANPNQINFTLSNNVIAILVWGTYIITCIILLNIPIGALSIVAAGLATGLGLAMKDILNNLIYGIQLMSGRVRVGDWVECDGVRGRVSSISYQSTQIETIDGAVMSFLNTALFNKNFKNLTRNNPYELIKINVGVAYGTDVEKAREAIVQALKEGRKRDKYGRPVVDASKGITVVLDGFGDSSVDLTVKVYVLVSHRAAYLADAREKIYAALNEAGIGIPFPQRDIHIIADRTE
jgi:small-conductance mechanosensitive channel